MSFVYLMASILLIDTALVAGVLFLIAGKERVFKSVWELPARLRTTAPYLVLVVGVLLVNKFARDFGQEISWELNFHITSWIHGIEGSFVARIQGLENGVFTTVFSFSYIYLYIFILVIPFVLYFTLTDMNHIRKLSVAFFLNYAIGVTCYILFISYGPRNFGEAQALMYDFYPSTQVLTSEVNTNTNVFPSLHSSLSCTVAFMSWKTRDVYPKFFYVATPVAASIIFATMYLGIHWLVDVLAGLFLAVLSVYVAERWVESRHGTDAPESERKKETEKKSVMSQD